MVVSATVPVEQGLRFRQRGPRNSSICMGLMSALLITCGVASMPRLLNVDWRCSSVIRRVHHRHYGPLRVVITGSLIRVTVLIVHREAVTRLSPVIRVAPVHFPTNLRTLKKRVCEIIHDSQPRVTKVSRPQKTSSQLMSNSYGMELCGWEKLIVLVMALPCW